MTGSDYMGLVARLTCALCLRLGDPPCSATEVHHRRSGTGGGQKASDFDTMPLGYLHHRDAPGSFHALGTKGFVKQYGITEDELIADTRRRLGITSDAIEEWQRAAEDRQRPKRARSGKAPRATRWPARKLQSANRLGSRPLRGARNLKS